MIKGGFFMEIRIFATPKFVVSIIVFLAVCVVGCFSEAAVLQPEVQNHDTLRIKLVGIENETEGCDFQIFSGTHSASAYVFPRSVFKYLENDAPGIVHKDAIVVKCCKGSFVPVYIQGGGIASGVPEDDFEGPYYLSMWLAYPQVPETSKIHVRYIVKKGKVGSVGLKIGNHGDYRFVAYDNVKFIVS